ncbi:hypothetical protein GLOIN_2v1611826 [Rhizophagus irregularis DAOM 181602=DAOM 197198]|uniref:Uncharacterized protein n=1 Tax=Rhizophagus irregularis (strain DAOM 181602 / DAOM 197198 / MUCL 43194) TaxID=747089 RepID=A0A2P4PZY1_RHIID|nr:hypothetical protein GLOIN_2v1611826 [Rhizophagus irregularis DAOM 181602=DAOM 197198]POG70928.1 hypothetical protein GLOIN_2v1611826 [Rhizophagus irregularis DAOM 181602=DAOM 197198]|eukprot:XP_025177794.1 hypothetical protein GLOIN_2v1611826 [Rhizophagus irregularis DAOM 181602=DAOM 197198]
MIHKINYFNQYAFFLSRFGQLIINSSVSGPKTRGFYVILPIFGNINYINWENTIENDQ